MNTSRLLAFAASIAAIYPHEIDKDLEIDGGDAVDILVAKIREARALIADNPDAVSEASDEQATADAMEGTPHPDEPNNSDRASRIDGALRDHAITSGMEPDEQPEHGELACFLADVRHWCDANDVDYHDAEHASYQHYIEELPIAADQVAGEGG